MNFVAIKSKRAFVFHFEHEQLNMQRAWNATTSGVKNQASDPVSTGDPSMPFISVSSSKAAMDTNTTKVPLNLEPELHNKQSASFHCIVKTSNLAPRYLAPTMDPLANFLLGHQSITCIEHNQPCQKYIDDLMQPFYFQPDNLADSLLTELVFPTKLTSNSVLDCTLHTKQLFCQNPVLRTIQNHFLDLVLKEFGLVRQKKEIYPDQGFIEKAVNLTWLNAFSEQGIRHRQILQQIINSLSFLKRDELAQSLCEAIKRQLHFYVPDMDLTEFDHALKQEEKSVEPLSAFVTTLSSKVIAKPASELGVNTQEKHSPTSAAQSIFNHLETEHPDLINDPVADFMLGLKEINITNTEVSKALPYWLMDDFPTARALPDSALAHFIFPVEDAAISHQENYLVTPDTQNHFIENLSLPPIQLQLLDVVLPLFGLKREEKSILRAENFHEKAICWLDPNSKEMGAKYRKFLAQITRSLCLLNNAEVGKNLHQVALSLTRQLLNPYKGQEFNELAYALIDLPKASKAPPELLSQSQLDKLTCTKKAAQKPRQHRTAIDHHILLKNAGAKYQAQTEQSKANVIGNHVFYYFPHNDEQVYKVFYQQNRLAGIINFELDKFSSNDELALGKNKKITHKNESSLYFKLIHPLTIKNTPASTLAKMNQDNYFLNSFSHIYSAYYLSREDMVARNAGRFNGAQLINQNKKVKLSLFKGIAENIKAANQADVYFTNISINKFVLQSDAREPCFNLLAMHSDIVKTASEESHIKSTYPYLHSSIKNALAINKHDQARVNFLLANHNNYAFLLSVFLIHSGQQAEKLYEQETLSLNSAFTDWLSNVINTEYLPSILEFIKDPCSKEIDLFQAINWEHVDDPMDHKITASSIIHFPLKNDMNSELAKYLCTQFQDSEEDELGNKAFVYPSAKGTEQTTYFFNKKTYLGAINFSQDKSAQTLREGSYKKVSYQNAQTIYFDSKIRQETIDCQRTNKNNHYFDSCQYIIPAYYVHQDAMIARHAGNINAEQAAEKAIKVRVSAFKELVAELEDCHANNIYVSDIKPKNLVLSPDHSKLSLIDIDTGVIDTSKKIVLTNINLSAHFCHSSTLAAIRQMVKNPEPEKVSKVLRQNNYYGLLLSMFLISTGKTAEGNDFFTKPQCKTEFTNWLFDIIKPEHLASVLSFVEDPVNATLLNLFDTIKW